MCGIVGIFNVREQPEELRRKALEGRCERYEPFLPGHLYWSREPGMKRQLMSDVPYGVLLSGGLDSSVISAIAETYRAMRIEDNSRTRAWWPRLHSFAVGLKGAPDLAKARLVAGIHEQAY